MRNVKRFQELCHRAQGGKDAAGLHQTTQELIELLREEELNLLSQEFDRGDDLITIAQRRNLDPRN